MKTLTSAALFVALLACAGFWGACSDDDEPGVDLAVDLTVVDLPGPGPDLPGDTGALDAAGDLSTADAPAGDQTLDLPAADLATADLSVADAGGDKGAGCGAYTAVGCCDGETLKLCVSNKLVVTDCAKAGKPKCGWNLKWGWYACGSDGSGDPSGKSPKSCLAKPPDAAVGCGVITTQGCCQGTTLRYCDNGKLKISDCSSSPKCGWDAASKFYDCGTSGGSDPAGKHPISCTGTAVDAGAVDAAADLAKPDAGNACKGISKDGCCAGEVLKFCDSGGNVVSTDCAATKNPKCGWDASYGWYNCGTAGGADPAGKLPKACPGTVVPDAALPDKSVPDAAVPDKAVPDQAGPTTPKIVITELMIDPKAVKADKGQWFEIHNAGATVVDLLGWTVSDKKGKDQQKYTFKSPAGKIPFKAGGYLLVSTNQIQTTNGKVPVDLRVIAKWTLDKGGDEIYLHDAKGLLVDKVEYKGGPKDWKIPAGATLSLKSVTADNNAFKSWCVESKQWCATCDRGTPKKKPGCN